MQTQTRLALSASAVLLSLAVSPTSSPSGLRAQAWPQYAGPGHDRRVQAEIGLTEWPDDGPPIAWRVATPTGFSSFAVTGGRACTLVTVDGAEACRSFDATTGETQWTTMLTEPEYDGGGQAGTPDNKGGDGPRSTPSIVGDLVYCFDADLVVHCLQADDGTTVWSRDLIAEHGGEGIRWQNAASPLVVDDRVFVGGGGEGQSLLALDAADGSVVWKAHDEQITHATPVHATIHGAPQVIWFTRAGLVAVAPDSGDLLWHIEYAFRVSTAASPVVHGDIVYCSAGYSVGAGAFRITRADDGTFGSELLWRKRNKLMNHWSTPVAHDGHLYGMFSFKKYGSGPMKCVELETGETKWSVDGFGPGNCILVGGHVVALGDAGQLVLATADPSDYREVARADVLDGKCWSSPAFANGSVFVRSTEEGVRVDLTARGTDD